jgi:hypothetical protein
MANLLQSIGVSFPNRMMRASLRIVLIRIKPRREGSDLCARSFDPLQGAALAFGSGFAAHEQRETFHGFPP